MTDAPPRPTLLDVARAAGVSIATASRALSGRGSVAASTREAVRRIAADLEFAPSPVGRSLRTRATRMIGFVVPDISSSFYAQALKGAQHRLAAAGYQVALMDTDERADREQAALVTLAQGRVDGIILCSASGDPAPIRTLERRHGLPIVFFDNILQGVGVGRVVLDNVAGIRQLIGHLVGEHGHTRIGYVGGLTTETSGSERREGFRLGLLGHGLTIDDRLLRDGTWTVDSGREETAALLGMDEPPTAIVYADADMALGGLGELRSRSIPVPDRIAIVSFDDSGAAPLLDPPLTALARRGPEIGDLAASMILRALEHETAGPMDVSIPMELVVRRSCGCEAALAPGWA